jgi:hypothetical protein
VQGRYQYAQKFINGPKYARIEKVGLGTENVTWSQTPEHLGVKSRPQYLQHLRVPDQYTLFSSLGLQAASWVSGFEFLFNIMSFRLEREHRKWSRMTFIGAYQPHSSFLMVIAV